LGTAKKDSSKTVEWDRERELCNDERVLEIVDMLTSKNPSLIQDPCQLPQGYYTWILTDDWQLTFGSVINNLEWGVKHRHLANCRFVIAGGEWLTTASGSEFNLSSGTFDDIWEDTTYEKELIKKLDESFKSAACSVKNSPKKSLFKKPEPRKQQVIDLCNGADLKKDPKRMTWKDNGKSICQDYSCLA